jgi:hypothetical protein
MRRDLNILIGAVLIALIAPVVAESPSDAVVMNRDAAKPLSSAHILNPNDPGFVWGSPLSINLSGVSPVIFQSASFNLDTGGLASGNLYTTSINEFRSADSNAGKSNATKKAAKIGLVHWP